MGSIQKTAMQFLLPVIFVILTFSLPSSSLPKGSPVKKNSNIDNHYHRTLESAIGDFSQSLYVQLAERSGSDNFVFSPLSLHSALTLLYLGTRDNSTTQQQLGAAMGIVNNPKLLKQSYQKVIETYKHQKSFLYGNHIWVGKGYTLKPDYKDLVTKQF